MNGNKCPFCNQVFNAGKKTNTNIFRHIRKFAHKPSEKRGNHPEINSPEYQDFEKKHFRRIAKSPDEKTTMSAARKQRSRERVKQKGSGSVNVPLTPQMPEVEVKKEEDESWSLQLSREVRERIAKAFQNLLYSPDTCSLTENARSHIDNPEAIPRPTNTLPLNPSFPQIVFYYLPFETCISNENGPTCISEHSDFAILSQYHYDEVMQTRLCSKYVLENAWTQWLKLGDRSEWSLRYQEAKDMRSRWLLFQKVLTGKHGYDLQRQHFQEECYQKGYAEIASVMKDGTLWRDVHWESFAYFAELYKPLPKVSGTGAAVSPPSIEDAVEESEDGDYPGVRGRRRGWSLKGKCVIPQTRSPEL